MLVHLLSRQKWYLPKPTSGEWLLGFFDDGVGFIADGEEALEVSQFLKATLYKVIGCEGVIMIDVEGDLRALEDYLSRFQSMSSSWRLGEVSAWADIGAALYFQEQAPGDRIFWNFHDIMGALDFEGGKTSRSKYIYAMWGAWAKFFDMLSLQGGFRRSAPFANATEEARQDADRVTAFPTISTSCLLAICAKWAFTLGKKRGGLATSTDRRKAKVLLEALLSVLPAKEWRMELFATGFSRNFPMFAEGSGSFLLEVNKKGRVDMSRIQDLQGRHDFAMVCGSREYLTLLEFVESVCVSADRLDDSPAFVQLVHAIGHKIDAFLVSEVERGIAADQPQVMIKDQLLLTASGIDWSSKARMDMCSPSLVSERSVIGPCSIQFWGGGQSCPGLGQSWGCLPHWSPEDGRNGDLAPCPTHGLNFSVLGACLVVRHSTCVLFPRPCTS